MMTSSRKARRGAAVVAALALALALPLGVASPASASPHTVAKHVALGDSIAAGQGGGVPLDTCARTGGSYGSQLDQTPKFNMLSNAACTGATVADVAATQLSRLNRGTTVVTLTVGANDVGVGVVYEACAAAAAGADPTSCQAALGAVPGKAQATVAPLAGLIAEIGKRSPNAVIVVTGYPNLLEPLPAQAGPIAGLVDAVNGATTALNTAIQVAAATSGANVRYADVTVAFAGHGVQLIPVGVGESWFGTDPVNDPAGYLHPTSAGYAAYAGVILFALGR